ncbi:BTB/POZ and TAZ domain-containing protein [Thalictrum thalictroides]|uniref:BTB/POZ and TAZ domain-containing protein n=1 Tax=Thalictrum thalictroides TaxID=46969 RepID=A0A7J6XCR9_THATH|nr:BTB/POZ and TAZ domain-containing protein [Thalictrum thalictroides]
MEGKHFHTIVKAPTSFPIFCSGNTGIDSNSGKSLEEADLLVVTSGGLRIPAHSSVLVSVSTVFKKMLDQPCQKPSFKNIIPILGVPCNAVIAFVQFLYSNSCTEEEMDRYGIHLLVLSHVYSVRHLKLKCVKGLGERLLMENVVDVLQLTRLCDAPDLYLRCMKMVSNNYIEVQKTEGWKFMQDNDPWLELEILQFLDELELWKIKRKKNREERNLYIQLSEAMECLEHICTEGCTSVGPYDRAPNQQKKKPCNKFPTCRGLQLSIKHFAICQKRVKGGCCACKRVWQILLLHSAICDQTGLCKVPLCRHFKLKMQLEKEENGKWKLLAKKVVSAKVMSFLSSHETES